MSNNIWVDFQSLDFEAAVDEVDILVPKYLDALTALEKEDSLEQIPADLKAVEAYWERLTKLFQQIEPLEDDIPFQSIIDNSLQSELSALERVYLKINLRIEFDEDQWTQAMWTAAEAVLHRMDKVLSGLGFSEEHEDRGLIQEMLANNLLKKQAWVRKGRQAS